MLINTVVCFTGDEFSQIFEKRTKEAEAKAQQKKANMLRKKTRKLMDKFDLPGTRNEN